jgi:hypothetical protein
MKKILFVAFVLFSVSYCANAQVNPHAIGLRLGGGSFNGAEISYQQGLSKANRLELDFGFGGNSHYNRLYATGIYQWDWNITSGLNWYIGPGASIGLFSYDKDSYINIALGGQIGLEYDFKKLGAPILLSLDFRPMWDFLGDDAGLGWGSALGIRYIW